MNKTVRDLLICVGGCVFVFTGYWFGRLMEPTWSQFDYDTKYNYERISPDSVILTVCTTSTVYYKTQ
jgi:hypothetical protein